jgi:hypothetical protein
VNRILFFLAHSAILASIPVLVFGSPEKDLLTENEILKIQDNREIVNRTKLYMDFAAARLKAAEERLIGKETQAGDPFEYFTPEDMLDNYCRIVKNLMSHLDDAYKKPAQDQNLHRALKSLKKDAESARSQLEVLKKIAEDQKKERLWNLVNKAIEITNDAHSGAEFGLSKSSPPQKK